MYFMEKCGHCVSVQESHFFMVFQDKPEQWLLYHAQTTGELVWTGISGLLCGLCSNILELFYNFYILLFFILIQWECALCGLAQYGQCVQFMFLFICCDCLLFCRAEKYVSHHKTNIFPSGQQSVSYHIALSPIYALCFRKIWINICFCVWVKIKVFCRSVVVLPALFTSTSSVPPNPPSSPF